MRNPSPSFRLPRSARLAALAVLSLSGVSAQACEIWRDKDLGIWRGNCDFRDKFQVSHSFLANLNPRLVLKFPDLHIREFDFYVVGSSVSIEAEIQNLGMANVAASDLAVDVSIANPLTGMQQGASIPFTVSVPAIAANSSLQVNVGVINVPNNMQDWDLVLLGIIDPPTPAQPVRGTRLESDETNNSLPHACRWFGPNPDTSLQSCN